MSMIIKFPKSKNQPENLWLFDENCQFFQIFEMIRIDSSLILKYLKNWN
jgi:hypothetical protein